MKNQSILNETCQCQEKTGFDIKNIEVSMTSRGKPITFVFPCKVCKNCKLPFFDKQSNEKLQKHANELIRKRDDLLTPEEIISLRKSLQLSRPQFGEYLRVLPFSVYLWEKKGRMQNKSIDELIRIKCNPKFLEDQQDELNRIRGKRLDQ